MGWNKDGSTVKAVYCDTEFTGVVLESRVKYGGKVQYKVASEPFYVAALNNIRSVVLVDEDDLLADFGVMDEDEYICRMAAEYTMDDVGCEFDLKVG